MASKGDQGIAERARTGAATGIIVFALLSTRAGTRTDRLAQPAAPHVGIRRSRGPRPPRYSPPLGYIGLVFESWRVSPNNTHTYTQHGH
jgi:hypothetical protein